MMCAIASSVLWRPSTTAGLHEQQGFGARFLPGEEFGKFMATNDVNFGETMKAIGLAK